MNVTLQINDFHFELFLVLYILKNASMHHPQTTSINYASEREWERVIDIFNKAGRKDILQTNTLDCNYSSFIL